MIKRMMRGTGVGRHTCLDMRMYGMIPHLLKATPDLSPGTARWPRKTAKFSNKTRHKHDNASCSMHTNHVPLR